MNKNTSSLITLLIIAAIAYFYRAPLMALLAKPGAGATVQNRGVGAPTSGYAANTIGSAVPFQITQNGFPAGELVQGIGFIPQSELDKNPNSPRGSLGITGYD